MRTKKRSLVVVLVLIALVLPVIVACGGKEDAAPQATTASKTSESSLGTLPEAERAPCTLASSGPLAGIDPRGQTVIWWHPYGDAREADLQAMIADFNTSNACGITVVAEHRGATLREEMRATLATGESPGLVVGDQDDQAVYTLANGLVELNAYIADETWGLSSRDREDFIGSFLEGDDDQHFGFPLTRTVDVLFYNQTWLEELRFSGPPTGTATFKDMACAAARVRDADGYVLHDVASAVASWTDAIGGTILNHDRTGYSYNTKAVIDTVTFLQELYDEGCAGFRTQESPAAQFAARRALFVQGSSADLPAFSSAMDAAENTDEWGVLTIPRDDAEPAPIVYGSDLMIPATNPETQLAGWVFLKWFAAPDQQAEWIRIAEEFPVRTSVVASLDVEALMPQWGQAFALLPYGVHGPRLASYPAVREAVGIAFDQILQGDDIRGTLSLLHFDANDLQNRASAEVLLPPLTGLCSPATSGPLAGVDPRGQTVTWWHTYSGAREADLHAMLDAFNAVNPCGITVVGESQGDAIHARINDAIATGELPGLAVGDQHDQAVYALADALTDLNAYMTDTTWGLFPSDRDDFFPAVLAQGVHPAFEGQRLGFPLARSVDVLFYNRTWLETLRHTGPLTTTAAFQTLTCAVARARDAAQTGASGYVLRDDANTLATWAAAFGGVSPAGGAVLNASGDAYAYNTPPIVAAMTYLSDLYDEECITSTITGAPSAHFAARRALFVLGSSDDIPTYQRAMEAAENTDVWGITTLPYSATVPAPIVYGSDFIIPATNPETQLAAWIFLKWFTAPEQQAHWVHASGDFPTRASVAAQVDDVAFAPQWLQALALLPYGVYEPQLISYPAARDAVTRTFGQIIQGADPKTALDRLTRDVNTLQRRMME
jgi:multiple sugar transport system substrate-binding protein/sn-glycerol 3-phosphate transport system substrate-binding protein